MASPYSGWPAVRQAVSAAEREPWFAPAGLARPEPETPQWRWYRRIMDFDPVPVLRHLDAPPYAAFDSADRLVPGERSAALLDSLGEAWGRTGNRW